MIRYITLGLLLIIFMLAIISRKNYSKYKANRYYSIRNSYVITTLETFFKNKW